MFKVKLDRLWTLDAIKNVIAWRGCHIFELSAHLVV